jgi:hypothetical protein
MTRRAPPDDAKTRMRRRRRAADTARWRSRRRRGMQLFKVEVGREERDLAVRFGGLRQDQIADDVAVSAALGRLLRRGLAALLREDGQRR